MCELRTIVEADPFLDSRAIRLHRLLAYVQLLCDAAGRLPFSYPSEHSQFPIAQQVGCVLLEVGLFSRQALCQLREHFRGRVDLSGMHPPNRRHDLTAGSPFHHVSRAPARRARSTSLSYSCGDRGVTFSTSTYLDELPPSVLLLGGRQ